jgi:DNA-binding MarR family transcriptional regulator
MVKLSMSKERNRGNWLAKVTRKNNVKKLLKLLMDKQLTYSQLKAKMKVSNPTLTKYLKDLEAQGLIEYYQKAKDRRSKVYRFNPNKKEEVRFIVEKQIVFDTISRLNSSLYLPLIHFLELFLIDLVKTYVDMDFGYRVSIKAVVEEAIKETFKNYNHLENDMAEDEELPHVEIDEEKIKKAKEEFEKKTGMTLQEALKKAKPMETRDLDGLIKKKKEADKERPYVK